MVALTPYRCSRTADRLGILGGGEVESQGEREGRGERGGADLGKGLLLKIPCLRHALYGLESLLQDPLAYLSSWEFEVGDGKL